MDSQKPFSLIVGAGPGLGSALVDQFSKQGYHVVGLNRSPADNIDKKVKILQVELADSDMARAAIMGVIEEYGVPDVLIHNTAQLFISPFENTPVEAFEGAWRSMVLSGFHVMKEIVPKMALRRSGTVIVSGATASLRAGAQFSAFASAKFALRGLVQSIAREYQQKGVHIAHVVLDGILDTQASHRLHSLDPSDMMSTIDVAQEYIHIAQQKPSAWTHELDLRPKNESF